VLSAELGADGALLGEPAFVWKDHSRFVEVVPVRTGWLVFWGHYEEQGRRRVTHGYRTYRDVAGVRRRLAGAIVEFTGREQEAAVALAMLDRQGLPPHAPQELPEPL